MKTNLKIGAFSQYICQIFYKQIAESLYLSWFPVISRVSSNHPVDSQYLSFILVVHNFRHIRQSPQSPGRRPCPVDQSYPHIPPIYSFHPLHAYFKCSITSSNANFPKVNCSNAIYLFSATVCSFSQYSFTISVSSSSGLSTFDFV